MFLNETINRMRPMVLDKWIVVSFYSKGHLRGDRVYGR